MCCQEHTDNDGEPKDFFTQGLWGRLPERIFSTPLMESLEDSLDTGQMKMDFTTQVYSRLKEVHILFLTMNTLEVAIIYLVNAKLGRSPWNL